MPFPLISAHRGGPEDLYPANSLAAITASAELGVDLIEFDVRTTRDGRFVTYHDDSIEIDGRGRLISELTEAEVFENAADATTLEKVLRQIKGRAMAHVDLKDVGHELEISDICESILGSEEFILTSLEDLSVRRLRNHRPHIKVALSLGRDAEGLKRAQIFRIRLSEVFPARRVRKCGAKYLALNYKIARLGAYSWARRHGIGVLLWTINDKARLKSVAQDSRYWAFTTDYPRLALKFRSEKAQ